MTTHRGRRAVAGAAALVVAFTGAAASGSPAAAAPVPAGSKVVFRLQDDRIDEASGIGVGIRSKGVDYVENDSGDVNRFFALNARTGATAAVVTVPGATNVDWEDLQVAPAPSGTPSVWIADIGDNGADRSEVRVYRVPEPRVDPHAKDVALTSARPAVWRLRYPDGPTNAESLAVTPQGRAYVVTKSFLGVSQVYRLPARPDRTRVRTLKRVGSIVFRAAAAGDVGGATPLGSVAGVLATSAAVSPSGRLLAVRTYAYADVWRLHPRGADDGVAAALHTRPTRITLPQQRQGEGIAFSGGRLLLDSEYTHTPVWSVPLPATLAAASVPAATPVSSTPTSGASSAGGSSSTPTPTPRRSPATTGHGRFGGLSFLVVVVLLGSVVLLGRRARRLSGGGGGRR